MDNTNEIKKSLQICIENGLSNDCKGCGYREHRGGSCIDALMEDALAVILRLEGERREGE